MIFFYVNKTTVRSGEYIPIDVKTEDTNYNLTINELKIYSWNEVQYDDSGTIKKINTVNDLKAAVVYAAKKDAECIEINKKAFAEYGISLFTPCGVERDANNSVNIDNLINRIFFEWAHPMIGNIRNSPNVRPQTMIQQYNINWSDFPVKYMDNDTKQKIKILLGHTDPVSEFKLEPLQRSSHDQVRLCRDLTTLARAIIGEITTIATRRMEKLFALELYKSAKLLKAQKALIKTLLKKFITVENNLNFGFNENSGLTKTEYIKFYFVESTLLDINKQWHFYTRLIEVAIEEDLSGELNTFGLDRRETDKSDKEDEWLAQWRKLPCTMRCTVILNSFRRFLINKTPIKLNLDCNKLSIEFNNQLNKYKVVKAAGKDFIPAFTEDGLKTAWSWNRNERHETTLIYRKHLLPLWGGPSGHSHGHVSFAYGWLDDKKIEIDSITHEKIDIAIISLSSLFPFWRLYYDKRISAIHTIAETYEASISAVKVIKTDGVKIKYVDSTNVQCSNNPADTTEISITAADSFDIVLDCFKKDTYINPIRLMNVLKARYYDVTTGNKTEKFTTLKSKLDTLRGEMSATYYIPLWSKPIIYDYDSGSFERLKSTLETGYNTSVLSTIKIFVHRNIKVLPASSPPPQIVDAIFAFAAKTDILSLYSKFKQQGNEIILNEESLDSCDIPMAWKRTILTDCITISESEVSGFNNNQFFIKGKVTIFNYTQLPAIARFSLDSSGGLLISIDIEQKIENFVFSDYYKDIPKTIDGMEFLSDVVLKNLTAIKINNKGLAFSAEIDTDKEFLNSVKPVTGISGIIKADCEISASSAVIFKATAIIGSKFHINDNLSLEFKSITLESGLVSSDCLIPKFTMVSCLGDFITTVYMRPGSSELNLIGEFNDNKVFSLKKVAALLGLPEEISFLPPDLSEAVFGNLGLLEISIQLNVSPLSVRNVSFTVSAEKPWDVFSKKITLKPYLMVSVDNPFNAQSRQVDLQIQGSWKLGSTAFLTGINPTEGDIYAYMDDGQTLDVSAVVQSFMGGLDLPQMSISTMELFANYKNKSYEIVLKADKLLISVCGVKIGLSDVSFYMCYASGSLENLELGGTLNIGELQLSAQGIYRSGDDWEFTASGFNDVEVSFQGLWNKFTKNFISPGSFDALVPSKFLSFKIGTLFTAYKTKEKKFNLLISLEKIYITESFIIDSVLSEIIYEEAKLESLKIKAEFNVVGVSLILDINKLGDGFKIKGGTKSGQDIVIGKLLSDFGGEVLGYSVVLPAALNAFVIKKINFIYSENSKAVSFSFDCAAAFTGENTVLANIFSAEVNVGITALKNDNKWSYGFCISCEMLVNNNQSIICSFDYDNTKADKETNISLKYIAKNESDAITLADILSKLGMGNIDAGSRFLSEIGLSEAEAAFDFAALKLKGRLKLKSGGTLDISVTFGENLTYNIKVTSTTVISLSDVPVLGGLTQKFIAEKNTLSVKDLVFYALSEADEENDIPPGLRLDFMAFGEKHKWQIYQKEPVSKDLYAIASAEASNEAPKTMWLKVDKTVAILTLHRIGLGLDGSYLMFVLDASLNVSPLTFTLYGAGIGVNISDFNIKVYLTGFGVSFDNGTLIISGEFNRNGKIYSGSLLIQIKQIAIFAIAEYNEDGNLFAYAVVSARLGGPPAFFITGLALGFGYNKRIKSPAIDKVVDFPLIKAAMGKTDRSGMLRELKEHIVDEKGQKFLSFGIKFTTFEIIESFILLTVSFGNSFEIDLLGLSEITMPPKCPANVTPIAHAGLALKASIRPEEGFLGVEARLTSESYILSKDCHLTGGFAFYTWFGGEHSGDFVITLGGYHPKYALTKPSHYPDVPRVGFNWNIGSSVNINGEMYFALTPNAIMAGGRLSLTYTQGSIKAYFIAKMDMLIAWKPYHYDIEIGVLIGASLRVKVWFVSFTITIELGANLHIWGPEFTGIAHVSLWIVSFDIYFGASASQKVPDITWNEFCSSFLPKKEDSVKESSVTANTAAQASPLKVSFCEGLNGQVVIDGKEIKSVNSNGVVFQADTVIPINSASLNNGSVHVDAADVNIKPMGQAGKSFSSSFAVTVTDSTGKKVNFNAEVIKRNMPTAIWGGSGELIPDVPCGLLISAFEPSVNFFPENQYISLDDLYEKGAIRIYDAFKYMKPTNLPSYTNEDTITLFKKTIDSQEVSAKRKSFLKSLGINLEKEISLKKYAQEADSYLDEEVLTVKK